MKTLQELEQQLAELQTKSAELQEQIETLKAKPLSLDDLELYNCNRWYICHKNDIHEACLKKAFDTAFFTKEEAYAFQQWNKVRRAWLQANGACNIHGANYCILFCDEENQAVIYPTKSGYKQSYETDALWFRTKEQAQAFIDFMKPYGAWNKETYELK